jgi:hypothetical protein
MDGIQIKEVSPFSHSRHPIFHVYEVGMEIYYESGKHIYNCPNNGGVCGRFLNVP